MNPKFVRHFRCVYFAALYPALIASSSNMYFPCFVFPYQRDPFLWYTPVSVLTQTIPWRFSEDIRGLAGAEDAGLSELWAVAS
jgi:hypothetical protein